MSSSLSPWVLFLLSLSPSCYTASRSIDAHPTSAARLLPFLCSVRFLWWLSFTLSLSLSALLLYSFPLSSALFLIVFFPPSCTLCHLACGEESFLYIHPISLPPSLPQSQPVLFSSAETYDTQTKDQDKEHTTKRNTMALINFK